MKKANSTTIGAAAAALFLLAILPGSGTASEVTFKGNVIYMEKDNLSLAKKFELAHKEFKKEKTYDAYFTGYIFLSRHDVQFGDEGRTGQPYKLYVKEGRIKLRRTWKEGFSSKTDTSEEGGSPAGVVFLHNGKNGNIEDVRHIDLEETYAVEDFPFYWFGKADNGESFAFMTHQFEKAEPHKQDEFIFFIGSHVFPKACDILRKVALGSYPSKARESAIFWLGSNTYDKSLDYLREIYRKEGSTKMREKVIFSLYILGGDTAVRELIDIARYDKSSKVRKQAIFWLGQRASKECVKALKDVIDDTDEETKVKESAVFAISQLPKEECVPLLIEIARSNKNPKVRENAIFWLGQKDDEKALKFFEEILLKKKGPSPH
ncbi:MAG: HEAT repeat domain-containing protein [Candidatus Aminicenantes bacterium]|jgi:hypothetical protein